MGIIDTIIRSKDDLVKPIKKSYWGCDLGVKLVDVKEITEKTKLLPTEKRSIAHELSGKEPVKEVIILRNNKKLLGRLTTNQVKDILDDMGFNVDTIFSAPHFSDFAAVININGFVIPGWIQFVKVIKNFAPNLEKILLTKLAPGKERLHIRVFENNSGDWIIIAHTDWNWMSLNLARVYNAHITEGSGDYETGTQLMYRLLLEFDYFQKNNKIFPFNKFLSITRQIYLSKIKEEIKFTFARSY